MQECKSPDRAQDAGPQLVLRCVGSGCSVARGRRHLVACRYLIARRVDPIGRVITLVIAAGSGTGSQRSARQSMSLTHRGIVQSRRMLV